MIQDLTRWIIDYYFEKEGKYEFIIIFYDKITNFEKFFEECINIISLDFSCFNASNITNLRGMFNKCLN